MTDDLDMMDFGEMEALAIPDMPDDGEIVDSAPVTAAPKTDMETSGGRPTCCLAFRGVTGGVGTTSLAIETAHIMASAKRGDVCLVDLDFALGMCAHYLDIGQVPSIEDLNADPARVDDTYVRAMLAHHEAGFAVLGAPGEMGANERVNPAMILRMLDVLSDMYPVLILDVPRLVRPWTQAALLAADRVCLVTELTIPALHVSRLRLDELGALGVEKADIVLSKYERRSFRASIRRSDAEKALGREVTCVIGIDAHTPTEAINCGEPAGRVSADSRFVKDAGALARILSPHFAERRSRRRR